MDFGEIMLVIAPLLILGLLIVVWGRKRNRLPNEPKTYFPEGAKPKAADVLGLCTSLGYERIAREIERGILPCAMLVPDRSGAADQSSCRSKIGGLPGLPNQELWPTHQGKSLSFIAQVNLREVPTSVATEVLPGKGLLCFFYDSAQSTWGFDPKDKGSWRVIYCDEAPAEGAITEYPNDIPDHARFTETFVRWEAASSMPDEGEIVAADPSVADERAEQVFDIFGQYEERRTPIHQLLGHPAEIQGDMRLEFQLASHGLYCGNSSGYNDPRAKELEPAAAEWRLLLQIDSDDDAGMMWGDGGRLYFWIRKDDLKNRKFESTWMVLQCY